MKIDMLYGMTVVNPECCAKIIMPKLTWREAIHCAFMEAWYIVVQSLLLAGSITAFSVALGLK